MTDCANSGHEKKVSVILPVYNAEPYIGRCLDSLLAQTYGNVELIMIDDGSADDSGRICDEYVCRFAEAKALHIPNGGVSAARNRGIEAAAGDYLTFVDADDCLEPDMLKRLVTDLEATGSDVAGCGYWTFEENGAPSAAETQAAPAGREVLSGGEFIEKGILAADTRCWSKLYTRESIGESRFDTGLTIGEDMLFLLEIVCKPVRLCRTAYKGYGYFINESGAMNHAFKDSYLDQIACWRLASQRIVPNKPSLLPKVTSIRMVSALLTIGKLALLDGRERKRYYETAVKCCKSEIEYGFGVKGSFRLLPPGYKIKTAVFYCFPSLYMSAYHWRSFYKTGNSVSADRGEGTGKGNG